LSLVYTHLFYYIFILPSPIPFLSSHHPPPPPLPSFPTRRSSDLRRRHAEGGLPTAAPPHSGAAISSGAGRWLRQPSVLDAGLRGDRKSTRLNSSHRTISYAVFCLKKKKKNND